jgi:hypothetical protein
MGKLGECILCDREEVRDFIEKHHYSKSINGLKTSYCFKLVLNDKIIGAIIYGYLGMAKVWKKYVDHERDLIELRRLCCIDETKKNTESYFISKTIKWLKNNTKIKMIISYADPEYNHVGIVYQACKFTFVGITSKSRYILYDGKKYHDKTIRTKYNGKLKPYAQKIKNALDSGKATYKNTDGKYVYIYELRNTRLRRDNG